MNEKSDNISEEVKNISGRIWTRAKNLLKNDPIVEAYFRLLKGSENSLEMVTTKVDQEKIKTGLDRYAYQSFISKEKYERDIEDIKDAQSYFFACKSFFRVDLL
ncbi:MAG: hypothetical protein IPM81_01770 [Saprospirales bacterium]|nr:hypothetical protein [Saprospirales bacterium]